MAGLKSTAEADEMGSLRAPKIDLPAGYTSPFQFLEEMRREFADDIAADRLNREAAIEDLRFMCGDQWDSYVMARRNAARKPTLTINRLPAFVAQIIGQRRQSETTINIVPDNGGTKSIARVREGLIRNIQKVSRADVAYDNALAGAVMCGIGNFQICLDYESDDVFDQEIKFKPINDHLGVVWDRQLQDATGRDARRVFVIDAVTKEEYARKWPWSTPSDISVDSVLRGDLRMNGWIGVDDIRIVEYWKMRFKTRTVALMDDGSTQDITDIMDGDDDAKIHDTMAHIVQRADGSPIMREVKRKFAQMYLCSGTDILEGPYELPISRVPVFRVPGWEVRVAEWVQRWGLIRFLKDPQRLHNYWRSVVAEKIMQTPRSVWMASDTAISGREAQWRNSHLSDDPLLVWNSESGQKPERVPPASMENALLGQAEITTQDLKDVSNIHEANLGMPSNEVSGAAIVARQRVSDTGTVIYHDNLNQAIEEAGRTCDELIPTVYDTPRIIKVLGADAQADMQVINAANNPQSMDISTGKYAVSVTTGPAYATKRMESADAMKHLANAMPQVLGVAADLIVESQDWPGAQAIADRLKKALPPGLLSEAEMTPEIAAGQAAQQKQQQTQQQVQLHAAIADYLVKASTATLNNARAQNFATQSELAPAKVQNESINTASQASDRELRGSLEAIKTAHDGG